MAERALAEILPGEPTGVSRLAPSELDPPITHGDPAMVRVLGQLERAAQLELPVFLSGEMGTGKKVAARLLHRNGGRAAGPLITVRCTAAAARSLSRELFGDASGPFEPSPSARPGAVSLAEGGTLILDSPGDLPPSLQAQLVELLDEGHSRSPTSLRWIATSRESPEALLCAGTLTQELYYHLSTMAMILPPLRRRRQDLPLIAAWIIGRIADRLGTTPPVLTSDTQQALLEEKWPGNIRQLRHALERAVLVAESGQLLPRHLRLGHSVSELATSSIRALAELEREAITRALAAVGGHRRRAAAGLGIGLRTLYDKIKRYGINAKS